MIRKILNISGRPGLYRLISQGRNMLIVEDLTTGRRLPVHSRERVSSLGDISIYTMNGDTPLWEVLEAVKAKNDSKPVTIDTDTALRDKFAQFLPEFDRDRVHPGDIRKLFQWYNLLIASGITEFKPEEAAQPASEGNENA